MVEHFRMGFLLFMVIIGLAVACEDEIKTKLELFAKEKTLKTLFDMYCPNGFIDEDSMASILFDAGVGYWCRWPSKVIGKFDMDGDGKLSMEEVISHMKNSTMINQT